MSAEERDFLDEFQDQGETASEADEPATEVEETADQPEAQAKEPEATAAPEAQKETHVPYAAMKAEREKRQERERELQERDRRLAELERQLEQIRSPQQQERPVEIWEDPDGFVSKRVQAVEQSATNRLYAALEEQAREMYPDYDEVFAVVQEHNKTNPAIGQKVLSAPNPALAAYKLGKQLRERQLMDDPEAYRAKVEAELRAKIEAEYRSKGEAKRKAVESIPPDLSASRNVAGNAQPVADDPFDTLFPRH